MDLCLEAERRPGPQLSKRWWEKDGLGVEGIVGFNGGLYDTRPSTTGT